MLRQMSPRAMKAVVALFITDRVSHGSVCSLERRLMTERTAKQGQCPGRDGGRSGVACPLTTSGLPSVRGRIGTARRSTVSAVGLVLVEVAMTNGWFLMHAPSMPVEAPREVAAPLVLSRGPCRGLVEAA
jgi:hypothetical protein